jgi:hypothetical protein
MCSLARRRRWPLHDAHVAVRAQSTHATVQGVDDASVNADMAWTLGERQTQGEHAPEIDPLPEALHRMRAAGRMRASRWGTDARTNGRDGLCVPRSMVPNGA